ncbi:MAG: hypothetical protein ACE5KT_12140 [Methanosarcinales archaeon]
MAYFLIAISGGGTWAFPEEEKQDILDKLNESDNTLAELNDNGELTEDIFLELYPKIFQVIRSKGKLIGRDIEIDEVLDKEDLYPNVDIRLPPEDLEFDEAVKIFRGEGIIPG